MDDDEHTTYNAFSDVQYDYQCDKNGFEVAMKGFQPGSSITENDRIVKASFLKKIASIRSQAPSPSLKIQIMGGKN